MLQENLRNVAIIAHVDHGKTTLVDKLLRATDAFRANQQVEDRVLDSNDQERERGITILAKNISIEYKGVKINVIDTPGHADFGGEVERVLRMADSALLLVDAFEGPMPQTRFVLRHAIDAGLAIMIVVNKIDRPGARPEAVVNDSLDLMMDLGATDGQLEFAMEHVVYASAVNGFARLSPDDGNDDMYPLLDMVVDCLPAPDCDPDGPLAMQCVTIDHSSYVGRIGIGRVYSGTIHAGEQILVVKNDGSRAMAQAKQLFTFDYLGRTECDEIRAGDIGAVVGIDRTDIGDVYTDPESPVELEPIEIDPPTLSVVFEASTSPLVGRDGDIVGARQLKERLMREAENNVTMRIEELAAASCTSPSSWRPCAARASSSRWAAPACSSRRMSTATGWNPWSWPWWSAPTSSPARSSRPSASPAVPCRACRPARPTRTWSSRSPHAASWDSRTASSTPPTARACSTTRSPSTDPTPASWACATTAP